MTFRHRAGVSPYTSPFGFAETCVFDKQSLGPFHCGHFSVAPLIPKLRGQFAEFLNNPSPAGLRFLTPSTCVGLRYGRVSTLHVSFSRHLRGISSLLIFSPFRPGRPSPGSYHFYVSDTLCSAATEFPPCVHRLRLSASP